jgi:hypothetical protein
MASDEDREARIPADQGDALIDAVTVALDLAHLGRTTEGYAVLIEGRQQAQRAAAGQPWSEILLARWQGALDRYAERYAIGRA